MIKASEDPIVEETRAVRRELADRFGDDIDALCDFLAAREREHPERLVSYAAAETAATVAAADRK
jgi:hypothetical protein